MLHAPAGRRGRAAKRHQVHARAAQRQGDAQIVALQCAGVGDEGRTRDRAEQRRGLSRHDGSQGGGDDWQWPDLRVQGQRARAAEDLFV